MAEGKTILIVEDDPTLMRGLVDNFRQKGYEVRSATDGKSGLMEALEHPPDLILLDIMLPKMNGYEVCRQLRQQQLDVSIIMLTAKGQESEIVEGLEWGADDYVTKPFSIHELLARVKALLRRATPAGNGVYAIGDATFDVAGHKLTRGGVEVPLTTKEYRMLSFFLSRPNRALTRNEIMNHVWGRSIIVSGRSVDRCIATLRSKIEPDPRQPTFIHTVRDVGYRFELLE
ncbi:MAG: response regulator transcription factor [Planctomycetes bacterium]|nr:response regulator transcription factor [Planctomycetota bacterium]